VLFGRAFAVVAYTVTVESLKIPAESVTRYRSTYVPAVAAVKLAVAVVPPVRVGAVPGDEVNDHARDAMVVPVAAVSDPDTVTVAPEGTV
jgi:hypothetical protein